MHRTHSNNLIYDPCKTHIQSAVLHTLKHTCTSLWYSSLSENRYFQDPQSKNFTSDPTKKANIYKCTYTSTHDKIPVLHTCIYTVHTCILASFTGPIPIPAFLLLHVHAEACTDNWKAGNGREINPAWRWGANYVHTFPVWGCHER